MLYLHWWYLTTSVEEVMHGLNALINAGKVLYLGVSDTSAWAVVKANDYAGAMTSAFFCLPRQVECFIQGHGKRDSPYVSGPGHGHCSIGTSWTGKV